MSTFHRVTVAYVQFPVAVVHLFLSFFLSSSLAGAGPNPKMPQVELSFGKFKGPSFVSTLFSWFYTSNHVRSVIRGSKVKSVLSTWLQIPHWASASTATCKQGCIFGFSLCSDSLELLTVSHPEWRWEGKKNTHWQKSTFWTFQWDGLIHF